ncbi:glycosyltransferase family 2 protein [Proteiniphilum acetatigenes]|uniref:glycosyltransferase family 2 protein n=1 Tax=Proteiniphilum acetatigenes TaxID=294710 RepID=UPI00035CFA06|nr:glycosyltransferase [Proteiniphilum acetatigenes]SFL31973.1 Glycosyl transferase family 2 [Porphyromonadaceae bacterium KH3CP3RA]
MGQNNRFHIAEIKEIFTISIVIPVYNSEKLLGKSVKSVIDQSNNNWELILVNDGSTDNSGKICDEYSKSDKRIRTIHIENAGSANARNVGIEKLTGDYCIFMDSDDFLEQTAIERLSVILSNEKYELVFYGYFCDTLLDNKYLTSDSRSADNMTYISNIEFKNNFFSLDAINFTHPVWNKMYKVELIRNNNILFPEKVNMSEDYIFNLQVYEKVSYIHISSAILYHYVSHRYGSITTKFDISRINSAHLAYKKSLAIIERWNPLYINQVENEYVKNVSVYINSMFNKECFLSFKNKRDIVKSILNNQDLNNCIRTFRPVDYRNKIFSILVKKRKANLILVIVILQRFISQSLSLKVSKKTS